jgi:hypothetical protein
MAKFAAFGVTSVSALCILGLATASGLISEKDLWKGPVDVVICTSTTCKQVASDILKDLHPNYRNLDPCNDFYKLVCDGFERDHKGEGNVNQCKTSETLITFRALTNDGSVLYGRRGDRNGPSCPGTGPIDADS